jgi:hypothetical protein
MKGYGYLCIAGTLCGSGCVVGDRAAGPIQYESRSIDSPGATRDEPVRVNLEMGAGDLKVGSGTSKLLQAYFTYNVLSWKPEVNYAGGSLTVRQPGSSGPHFGNSRYEWDLRFNRDTPLDMHVNFGAGEAQLDLGSLDLRGISFHMGVGKLDMDLRGHARHDYSVRIHGGVGEAIVHLPAGVAIDAKAHGGIGEIDVRGLRKEGSRWVSEGTENAKVRVYVEVEGGIGRIALIGDGA